MKIKFHLHGVWIGFGRENAIVGRSAGKIHPPQKCDP